jgi:hypothetical protein
MMSEYLGDGVYADYDGWQITLYTDNPFNVIYLDPHTLDALYNLALETMYEKDGQDEPQEIEYLP